jgi:hypothetical protein
MFEICIYNFIKIIHTRRMLLKILKNFKIKIRIFCDFFKIFILAIEIQHQFGVCLRKFGGSMALIMWTLLPQ